MWYYCKCDGEEHEVNVENGYDNDDSKFGIIIIIIIIIIILKPQKIGTQTFPSQCVKWEMSQYCGIKQYTQTEKLQQIDQT